VDIEDIEAYPEEEGSKFSKCRKDEGLEWTRGGEGEREGEREGEGLLGVESPEIAHLF
jgi:hypothetical protein